MSMDVIYEINYPDGQCWTTTPICSQAVDAAKAKAQKDVSLLRLPDTI